METVILSLLVLLLCCSLIYTIFINVIYPIRQFTKNKNEHGYILTRDGEFEHRNIAKKILKRELIQHEEVHHINGKKWDNRRTNLALMSRSEHQRWHQRLEWMHSKKMFPSINWQKKKLKNEFNATLLE